MAGVERARRARRVRQLFALGLTLTGIAAAAPSSAVAQAPLVGQWHLDANEPCGTNCVGSPDTAGYDLFAQLRSANVYLAGRFGKASARTRMVVNQSPVLESPGVTALAWVKMDNAGPGLYTNILAKGGDLVCGGASWGLYTGNPAAPGLRFYVNLGSTSAFSPSVPNTDINDSAWHMVAGTYDGQTVRLYVDGQQAGSGTPALGAINYALPLRTLGIGEYVGDDYCGTTSTDFIGTIDEARIYARALSATEIARLADDTGAEPPTLIPDPPPEAGEPTEPPKPADPDFSLRRAGGTGGDAIRVATGGTAHVPLLVNRNSTSTGRIELTAKGAGGVKARLKPTALTGKGSQPVDLILDASPNATGGVRKIRVSATPADKTAGPQRRSIVVKVFVQPRLTVEIKGIEVNQGVQQTAQPGKIQYDGLALVKNKKTVVRVYAYLDGKEVRGSAKRRPPLNVVLHGYDYRTDEELPGGPLSPQWSPPSSSLKLNKSSIGTDERNSSQYPYQFVLPLTWTERGHIYLTAQPIAPYAAGSDSVLCLRDCGPTPNPWLTHIHFFEPPTARVFSLVEEVYPVPGGQQGVGATPDELVSKLRALSPIPIRFFDPMGRTSAFPQWRAVVAGTSTQLFDPADNFDRSVNSAGDGTVGVYVQGNNPGVTVGHTAVVSGRRDSGVLWRPVTSIAHEWFHLLGFPHASPACGSGGEAWPWPNGRMGGVGLDTTGSAPYRVIPDTDETPGYDLMSYCGIQDYDAPHWISPINWTRAVESSPLRSLASAAAAGDDLLEVRAQASAGAVAITHAGPAPDTVPEGLARSPYSLVARNAAGAVVATVPLDRRISSESAGPDYLIGRVARAGVTAVQIVAAGGQVLATRSQSATVPTAKLLSPGRGARVGKGATVPIRLQVAGTVTDVEIDASSDGGRRYRTVYSGVDPGTRAIPLPSSLFQASRRARLRVRVSDGFRESTTVSKPFVVLARRPQVKILEPTGRLRTDAGGTVLLAGGAVDDQGRAIAGKSLVWRAGRRVIGRGAQVSAAIPAGVRSIRLTATDRHGRTGSASVGARVRTTAPLFVKLSAKRVSRGARRATVLVSVSQPATLRAGGRRFHVAPRAHRIRVPIRAGRKPARLRMVLSAGGRRSVNTLVIRRR